MGMRVVSLMLSFLTLGGYASKNEGAGDSWSYTRALARARGFWEVTSGTPGVSWIALSPGTSEDSMKLVWPTGLGCHTERATIVGKTITVDGDSFPAIVTIASFSYLRR